MENLFARHKVCVVVPTYNNAGSLEMVLRSIMRFTNDLIIVNDGSTDGTNKVLCQFTDIEVVSYERNRGKGHALLQGFSKARELGYHYAITIDSDGQHDAKDLIAFLRALEAKKQGEEILVIGARNMDQRDVPKKSSFGNRFSNFWFWAETGIKLPDTQSGYRLYPLVPMKDMRFYSVKYELEIEMPVRLAWKGVTLSYVPVSVYYPPAGERVTHFRPFRDFLRISVVNTFLTLIAFFWVHPVNFIGALFKKRSWKRFWDRSVWVQEESPALKASSVGFGVFMGIFPIWGFQLLIGIPLALAFRLNKALFLIAANVSVFPLTPIFWILSLWVGKRLLGYSDWTWAHFHGSLDQFKEAGAAFFIGGAVLALGCGAIAYLITYLLSRPRAN